MDENYYDYFNKNGFDNEFVNFLMGAGGSGTAICMEGGFGTFCAVASDRVETIIIPRE
jgi:predicted glycosyltransferase